MYKCYLYVNRIINLSKVWWIERSSKNYTFSNIFREETVELREKPNSETFFFFLEMTVIRHAEYFKYVNLLQRNAGFFPTSKNTNIFLYKNISRRIKIFDFYFNMKVIRNVEYFHLPQRVAGPFPSLQYRYIFDANKNHFFTLIRFGLTSFSI